MKKLLFILLVMCNVLVVAQEQKEWCRPVKEDVVLAPLKKESGPKIKVFQYEWFVVQGKECGNPKLGELFYNGKQIDTSGSYYLDYNKKEVLKHHESLLITMFIDKDTLYVNVPETDGTKWYKVIDQSNNKYIRNDVKEFGKYIKLIIPDSCSIIRISPDNRIVSIFNRAEIPEPIITLQMDTISIEGSDSLKCLTYRQLLANDSTMLNEYVVETKVIAKNKEENNIFNILFTILLAVAIGVIVYFFFYRRKRNKEQDTDLNEETKSSFEPKENLMEEVSTVHDKDNADVVVGRDIEQLKSENKNYLEQILSQKQEIFKLQPYKDNFEKEIQKIEADKKKEIEKIKKNVEVEINKAKNERDKALKKVDTISKELEDKFDKERKTLTRERDKAKEDLVQKSTAYDELHKLKEQITNRLQLKENEVVRLEQGQQIFTSKLTFVPFAAEYAKKIVTLFELSESIQAKIIGVLEMDIDDPYHIMKAVTKYNTAISTIDMKMFYTDVKMISEGQIALNSTTLAGLDQNGDKDSLDTGMRMYFFDRYLEKYVDALMVLNETMAGIHHLINSVPVGETRIFENYREQLIKTGMDLGLKVDSVKLFDKVGNKIGLSATLVDAGFSTGDILEIENCVVYFENGRRPETKIRVKVQE